MGGAIGILFGACLVAGFRQSTIDKAVFGVHDGRLGVVARFFLHTGRGLVAGVRQVVEVLHALLTGHVLTQIVEHLTVVLQQLQSQVSGGVVLGDMLVGLEVFLDVGNAVFYLVTVVDMQVTGRLAGALVYLDDSSEEFFHALAALKRSGYHRHTEKTTEGIEVEMVATPLEFVVHVQGADHAYVHVDELGGEVEIALEVGGVDHVDDHVGHLLCEMFPHIEFFWRIAAERVGAGQVGEVELVAEHRGVGLCGIYGHTAIVAHVAVRSTGKVEERGLAAVRIAHECHIDRTALFHCLMAYVIVLMDAVAIG